LLLLPHVWWQFSMNFPTFGYHLIERNNNFQWFYFLEYIPNQLVVFNPLAFGLIVFIFIKNRTKNVFERGLYFLTVGFLSFFWMTSFRGHVEPHWTVICTIPMIVLIYNHSLLNTKIMRFVKRWIPSIIILILIVRVLLVTRLLPPALNFYGKEERSLAIQTVAGELPVAFFGSFQRASDYYFFTKHKAFVLKSIYTRQTQFDIWQKELDYQGKPVFICSDISGKSEKYELNGYVFHGYRTENFQSVNRLKINDLIFEREVHAGDPLDIRFTIHNPTNDDIHFQHAEFPVTFKILYIHPVSLYDGNLNEDIHVLKSGENLSRRIQTIVPDLPAGDYLLALTLDNTFCVSGNSGYVSIKILNKTE